MFRWLLFFFYFSIVSSFLSIKMQYDNSDYSKSSILKYNYKNFFKKPIEYSLYSKNIIFQTNFSPPIEGKEQYKFIFNSLQFISKIIFQTENIDILYTKETIDEVEILWKLNGFTKTFFPISVKGVSVYEKDERGFLKSHNITLNLKPNMVSSFSNITEIQPQYFLEYIKQFCPNNDDDDNYPHPLLNRPIPVRI